MNLYNLIKVILYHLLIYIDFDLKTENTFCVFLTKNKTRKEIFVKPDLLILFSGGADSVLLLHQALALGRRPYCVLTDYDQNQKIELEYADRYLNEKSIPKQTVKLYQLGLHSGLTTVEKSLYDDVNEMYVPSRNLMFVSIAASIAENKRINEIWYGANATDGVDGFPDCTVEWVGKVNKLLAINSSTDIFLIAPLITYFKEEILKELEELGVDMCSVYSGYLEDNKDRMVVSLDFLGGRKLPKIDAKGILESEDKEIK